MKRQEFIADQKVWRISCSRCGGMQQCKCCWDLYIDFGHPEGARSIVRTETFEFPPNVVLTPAYESAGIRELLSGDLLIVDEITNEQK